MKNAADHDLCVDLMFVGLGDAQLDQSIIQQDSFAGLDHTGQIIILHRHTPGFADNIIGREYESLSVLQKYAALLHLADAQLRSLQVGHNGDRDLQLFADGANTFNRPAMIIMSAMAHVQTDDIHARYDKFP